MKTKVRDIPLGILLIVIGQFFIYGIAYLSNFPNFMVVLGIIFCVYMMDFFVELGLRVIKGIDVAESE